MKHTNSNSLQIFRNTILLSLVSFK